MVGCDEDAALNRAKFVDAVGVPPYGEEWEVEDEARESCENKAADDSGEFLPRVQGGWSKGMMLRDDCTFLFADEGEDDADDYHKNHNGNLRKAK
jgi:hypothetical protein